MEKIGQFGLYFELNENDLTTSIINSLYANGSIIIPRKITHNSNDYIIRSINQYAFRDNKRVKSITFSDDSELIKIEQDSFYNSIIESISLPPSLKELKEGWCSFTPKLKNVTISPNNKNFLLSEKKDLIFGKSDDRKSDEFDILLYANRNIEHVFIPSFVKIIGSFSFCGCTKIKSFEFSEDSKLYSINDRAFNNSSIKKIEFPQNLTELKNGWCQNLNKLRNISICPSNRNFSMMKNGKLLVGKSDKNSQNFDVLLYAFRDTQKVEIPSCIKYIGPFAFHHCSNLKTVVFPKKSELISIGEYSFAYTSIEKISFPSKLEEICDFAFQNYGKLNTIEFPSESKIHTIGKGAFYDSSIESVLFPSSVKTVGNSAFSFCRSLKVIQFEENTKIEKIGQNAFSFTAIESIKIPSNLAEIEKECFASCSNLKKIEFYPDTKLKIIREMAFYNSGIESITIPPSVEIIEKYAFYLCDSLKAISFSEDSELQSFEPYVFSLTSIESLSIPLKLNECKQDWCFDTSLLKSISVINNKRFKFVDDKFLVYKSDEKSDIFDVLLFVNRDIEKAVVPSYIRIICSHSFSQCNQLQTIEFSKDSELKIIEKNSFAYSSIESIYLPSTVEKIEQNAFFECRSLKSIHNFENLQIKTIEDFTFSSTNIESISIPSKVVEIKDSSFCDTENLNRIFVSPNNHSYLFINDSFLVKKTDQNSSVFDVLLFSRRNIHNPIIPSFITKISPYAFNDCSNIGTVTFEKNSKLSSIGKSAFSNSSIDKIILPSSLKIIGEYAFCECKMKSIGFDPESKLTTIEKNAFQSNSFVGLTIPSSVNYIGENAFYNNENLKALEFLCDSVVIESSIIDFSSVNMISFPNAAKITNFKIFNLGLQGNLIVFITSGAILE